MSYLGIEVVQARALAVRMRRQVAVIDAVLRSLAEAELLSQMSSQAVLPLDQVRADSLRSAAEIFRALAIVESFRLALPELRAWASAVAPRPERTPAPVVGEPPLVDQAVATVAEPGWGELPDAAWNTVYQDASHNSYAVPGGIADLFDLGVRSFELDIHRGDPLSLRDTFGPWLLGPSAAFAGSDHRPDPDAVDWRVYHTSVDTDSEYEYLTDGLAAIAALDSKDPITVFIDNKDAFDESHSPERFDEVLDAALGGRLYRPDDLLDRAPDATTMPEAVALAGWPTVGELEGRVIVVLTDNVDGYPSRGSSAFVAATPEVQRNDDAITHLSETEHVFYNANAHRLDADEIEAVQDSGGVVRTYFNPRCLSLPLGEAVARSNYRAVDVEPGQPPCGPDTYVPPTDTPVPVTAADARTGD